MMSWVMMGIMAGKYAVDAVGINKFGLVQAVGRLTAPYAKEVGVVNKWIKDKILQYQKCPICKAILLPTGRYQQYTLKYMSKELGIRVKRHRVQHHISYYPEVTAWICKECHRLIHRSNKYPDLCPSYRDMSKFYGWDNSNTSHSPDETARMIIHMMINRQFDDYDVCVVDEELTVSDFT